MRIEIDYPEERMAANRARLDAVERYAPPDRVPVLFGATTRFNLGRIGMNYPEYLRDPRTQMREQLLFQKWLIEELGDDRYTAPRVEVTPDFENAASPSACGCEIVVSEDYPPWPKPCIADVEGVHRFEPPEPTAGLWGKRLEWFERMLELRSEFEVIFNGKEIEIEVVAGIGGESPYMIAADMVGEDFLIWILDQPEVCHELLDKVTDGFIRAETHFRKLQGKPVESGFGTSDDSAIVISLEQYREFCVPYTRRMYDAFSGAGMRLMHLCGRMMHLTPAMDGDLRITHLQGYGFQNAPEEMGAALGGRAILMGNLNPVTLLNGPRDAIRRETLHLLEVLTPYGGIVVTDGYNLAPATPLENLREVVKATEEFARAGG